MRAYCFASGHIEFGRKVPAAAIQIAEGPNKELRDFICSVARHGYDTEMVKGRRTKIEGSDCLLVPGVPEAEDDEDQAAKGDALMVWLDWIRSHAPVGVSVDHMRKRSVPSAASSVRSDRAGPATPSGLAGGAR